MGYPLSSVERYRLGQLEENPYDLSDPLDRAIWTALQIYVDTLETGDLEERELGERESSVYASGAARSTITQREPARFEAYMIDLRDAERGRKPEMTAENRQLTALRILEALFAPAKQLTGRPMRWREGEYNVKAEVWEEGEGYLDGLADGHQGTGEYEGVQNVGEMEDSRWPAILTRVVHEPAYLLPERIAPLMALIIKNLGGLVSQSEAARRLGLTPRGVALRLQRGQMKHVVRVGQHVFLREADVEAAQRGRESASTP